jgi:hypothetical protein
MQGTIMEPGAFSVSLAVKTIEVSKLFYEKLGLTVFVGEQSQNWLRLPLPAHQGAAGRHA